jgi:signal transduction histidine kinase/ligand-binding sensor domain-containing protein
MKRIRTVLLIFVIVLCNSLISVAQLPTYYLNPDKKLTQYICQSWNASNGLPSNALLHACQTSDGYLWISGYSGLIRFDGSNFKIFNKLNTPQFNTNAIKKLAEDEDENLWLTTQGSGLVKYKNGKFKAYGTEFGLKNIHRALYIDRENKIWSGSSDSGWFYLHDEVFHFIESELDLRNIELRSITKLNDGRMVFGTLGHGIFILKNNTLEQFTTNDGLPSSWIYALYQDETGKLWIGTSSGLAVMENDIIKNVKALGKDNVYDILKDKHNNLWVGTIHGLYRNKAGEEEYEFIDNTSGLHHNFISDFLFDAEGNLWMVNYKGGLSKLKDGKFTNYSVADGLSGKVVNAICELDSISYLAAFDNGKINKIVKQEILPFNIKTNLTNVRIRHIMKDSKNNIWISTYGGLVKIDEQGNETLFNRRTGFPGTKIRLSFEDSKGNIWVGSRNNGLIKIDTLGVLTAYNTSSGLAGNLVMAINEDGEGNILVGFSEGEAGLSIISPEGIIQKYGVRNGLVSDIIFNIHVEENNNIWFAANGGVSLFRNGTFYNITSREGLQNDSPFDIIDDGIGSLWMPCSEGVMRVNKHSIDKLINNDTAFVVSRLFNSSDGMIESECNSTTQSLFSQQGTIWFPTINGIAIINPSHIPTNNSLPEVLVERITVDKENVEFNTKINIKPGFKRVSFYFTALSLYESNKIKFKYKLEGFDDEWSEPQKERSISYTNLSPGNYQFKIMASNNDGVWNEKPTIIEITVKASFYQTFWFYVIVVIALLGIAYLVYNLRIKQLEARQLALENEIELRTLEVRKQNSMLSNQKDEIEAQTEELKAQRDEIKRQSEMLRSQKDELKLLNASKDKMFSIISHDLRAPVGNFMNILELFIQGKYNLTEAEMEENLSELAEMAKSTYDLLDNLLNWSISQMGMLPYKPSLFQMHEVVEDTLQLAMPMSKLKNITIKNEISDAIQAFADSNMIRTVLRNLLVNAIKFTPNGGSITLKSETDDSQIILSVSDTGIGIGEKELKNLFTNIETTTSFKRHQNKGSGLGLLLCKEFIEKNNGIIWVESSEGNGSTFFFSLPAS